jgi:hypothetical protein
MMRCPLTVSLLTLGLLVSWRGYAADMDADSTAADEQTLRAAKLGTDGPALLDFFRKHTLTESDRERLQRLVKELGDKSFRAREKASAELVEQGAKAISVLRPALRSPDREVARRAEECLRRLESDEKTNGSPVLATAVVRLIAVRKPEGTAEILLSYLPFADHESIVEEIQTALAAVAVREGKPDPALTAALTANEAMHRGVAGAALARARVTEQGKAIRKLLQDADAEVRLRVGLALAGAREKEAIPVLIELLGTLSPEQLWPVEELLQRLAQDRTPNVSLGLDPAGRTKCHDAWAAWWRDRGATLEMTALTESRPHLGHVLMAFPDSGKVVEFDRAGKPRWEVNGFQSPFFAQALPGDRVLVAEYTGRVTERNLKGEILWQFALPSAMQCRRLENGNTFIVSIEAVVEVDRSGKEVWRHNRPGPYLLAARKLRNGQVVVMDGDGTCRRIDRAGKELGRFATGRVSNNCLEILPNGNILVAKCFDNRITEYDAQGKKLREMECVSPFCTYRLPNGNTLVACYTPGRVVELDRAGKIVRDFDKQTLNLKAWFTSGR